MRPEIEKIIGGFQNNMTQVNLVNLGIRDDEINDIMITLKLYKSSISVINFDNNNLTDAGAVRLVEHLSDFPQMKHLMLQYNKIGEEGLLAIFRLRNIPEHEHLDLLLRGNLIADTGKVEEIKQRALGSNVTFGR